MSELEKLKATLRRAATDGAMAGPLHEVPDTDAGVVLFLGMVEDTALARTLTCVFDTGARLSCVASGRRLIALLPPAPAGLDAPAQTLFKDDGLAPDDAEALGQLLRTAFDGTSSFTAESEALDTPPDPSQAGVSPDRIRQALGIAAPPQAASGPLLEAFLAAIDPHLVAALWVNGEDVDVATGEEADASALTDWAIVTLETVLDPDFPLGASLETGGLLVFGDGPDADRHHLIAGHRGHLLIAELRGEAAATSLAAWRHIQR